ncbi:MAG TPA: TauD/TfdA family dioxygenase [Ideonella sp.]|nr:TauD/TfdA family dioxygenase [Ideonella sp.]
MSAVQAHSSQSFAWRAASFQSPADYSLALTPQERQALVEAVKARPADVPVHALGLQHFALGLLSSRLRAAYQEVRSGKGFVVLRGLPVDELALDDYVAAVWAVGLHFGDALSQNAGGELVGHVVDASADDATPRMYRSNLELRPHNDITAMASLACWHKSQTGGASVIVSAVTVHDVIAEEAPQLLAPLYRGFHHHRIGEEAPGEVPATPYRVPVFAVEEGALSCRYLRSNMVAGHKQLGVPFTDEEIAAMNGFDRIATAPENRLAFFLERGEMIVMNNYTVMHARTSFTNFPEPERKRHLVRLWLDAPGFRQVPESFNLHAGSNGVPRQEGKRASLDFKRLYADDPVATGGVADLRVSDEMASAHR